MVTLRPESFTEKSKNATGNREHHTIFNIDANSIYFTIDNPYGRIQAIPLMSMPLTEVSGSYILNEAEEYNILTQNINSAGLIAADNPTVYPFFVSNSRQYNDAVVRTGDEEYHLNAGIDGMIIVCVSVDDSLVHCYTRHTTSIEGIQVDDTNITLQPSDEENTYTPVSLSTIPYPVKQPYSLRAIIEAIQELNRRTAFMDGSLGIFAANDMHDVKEPHDNALHESTTDGLPGLVNGSITGAV
jgi:hypothetical protein